MSCEFGTGMLWGEGGAVVDVHAHVKIHALGEG